MLERSGLGENPKTFKFERLKNAMARKNVIKSTAVFGNSSVGAEVWVEEQFNRGLWNTANFPDFMFPSCPQNIPHIGFDTWNQGLFIWIQPMFD